MLDLNFTLPDFTSGLKMNLSLIESWRNDPEMFRDGVRFDSVYDCFPRCKANGGRHYLGLQFPSFRMHATFAALNDAGVKARLDFEDGGARAVVAAGDHHAVVVGPVLHDGATLQRGVHV